MERLSTNFRFSFIVPSRFLRITISEGGGGCVRLIYNSFFPYFVAKLDATLSSVGIGRWLD